MKLRKLAAASLLCAALSAPASALTVELDGQDRTAESCAVLVEDAAYVGLRAMSTMLDPEAKLCWADGMATVAAGGVTLLARPGDGYILADGEPVEAKYGVRAENGSILVPLRTLCAALKVELSWDESRGAAVLRTAPERSWSDEDLYWLSRIISAESRGEPFQGKLAVGTVVLNRVKSPEFPDTVHDVIFDMRWGGQFEPVRNGTVYNEPTAESVTAARMCLEGAREAGESLYFLAPALTNNRWTMKNCTYVTTIGAHWFYK